MKVNVELECTPEEARAFLGLPDLRPMQEAVLARVQQQMLDGLGAASPEALLRAWLPLAPQAPEAMQQMMGAMFRMFSLGADGRKPAQAGEASPPGRGAETQPKG